MYLSTKKDKNYKGKIKFFDIFTEPVFLLCLFLLGIVIVYAWLAKYGNGLEKYTDIVCEYTSIWNSNKSGERNLVYFLAVLGSVVMLLYYFFAYKKNAIKPLCSLSYEKEKNIQLIIISLLVASSTLFFVYGETNPFLLAALLLSITTYVIDKERSYNAMIIFVLSLYSLAGIYRLYVLCGGNKRIDVVNVVLMSTVITILVLFISRKRELLLKRILLFEQIFVPFTLLIFLMTKYKVGEEINELVIPRRISYLIWFTIIFFVLHAIYNAKKKWNDCNELSRGITFGTLVCVMNFNNFSGSGQIISSDLHHPFENIIGFSQIFEHGQVPFSEYIPVSGMYSIIQGAFLWFFGKGYYSYYSVTENLFYFAITVLVVWLLKKHLSDDKVMFVSLLVPIIRYNRVALIIPFMLFLAWPKIIEKRNLWLKLWMLTSLVNGLYYPVFGAAVCLGFMPLAIYQIVKFVRDEFHEYRKRISFWIGWIVCILPVVLCVPLLLGTLKHMLAMGNQTIYADGISRFGQALPDDFFGYIQSIGVRLIAYYVSTFFVQASIVWISTFLTIRLGKIFLGKKEKGVNIEAAMISLSFGIAIMISFTYTLIRIDLDSLYSRSSGIIFGSVIMIIIISARYLKDKKAGYIFIGAAVFFVALVSGESIFGFGSSSELEPYYTVAEDYVLSDGYIPRLGQCYVQQNTYHEMVVTYDGTRQLDLTKAYVGLGSFGDYYLSDIKGDSVMETLTIKGYGAAQETVDLMRKNGSITYPVDSLSNYYYYNWLLLSGEYIWSPDDWQFCPNEDGLSVEEVRNMHKNIGLAPDNRHLGRTPSSWGSSMESLEDIFSNVPANAVAVNNVSNIEITFDNPVNGEDADFIYIEFADSGEEYVPILYTQSGYVIQTDLTWYELMKWDYNCGKVVTISWDDDYGNQHNMNCALGRGKLLIPLGSGCSWLLNSHETLSITFSDETGIIDAPDIVDVRMLKVREVE